MVDRAEDNKAPTRNAPNSDREPQRSRGPDDRLAPPHRGEMNRKNVPGRESAAPSSLAPVANRFTTTESLTKKTCNRLLQQNRAIRRRTALQQNSSSTAPTATGPATSILHSLAARRRPEAYTKF